MAESGWVVDKKGKITFCGVPICKCNKFAWTHTANAHKIEAEEDKK